MAEDVEILDDSAEYYRHLGIDDAQIWLKGLIASDNLPEDLPLERILQASQYYFNKFYDEKGIMGQGEKTNDDALLKSYKEIYEKAFTRKAILFLKDIRKKQMDEETRLKALKSEYALEGGVEAARWFAAVSDASWADKVTDADAERIANISYKFLHDTEENKELRTSFVGSFIRVSKILFSSLNKE